MPTILLVDDSAVDRRLAGGLLQKQPDLQVISANDGKEALAILAKHAIDVVVTDLVMPEMDGLQLTAAVKCEYPLIPVVLITGQGSEEIAVQALREGAASYVPKRRMAKDLVDAVRQVLAVAHEDRTFARLMHRIEQSKQSFVLENDIRLIHSLVAYLQQMTRCVRLADETERMRVGIAIEEAILNAFYHGNLEVSSELREDDFRAFDDLARKRCNEEPYCRRKIFVDVRFSRDEAIYVIRDEGPGFDPVTLPDPTEPPNLEKPSGRGILLMRAFMDEVIYNETGNMVTLVKRNSTSSNGSDATETL